VADNDVAFVVINRGHEVSGERFRWLRGDGDPGEQEAEHEERGEDAAAEDDVNVAFIW
jgi:hypothetical protein